MIIIGIDPSGNWGEKEGYGITGIAMFDSESHQVLQLSDIKAIKFSSRLQYWQEHVSLVYQWTHKYSNQAVHFVVEDFQLQNRKALQQSGESMATPRLLGILEDTLNNLHCNFDNITYSFQLPSIKSRFPDRLMREQGYLDRFPKTNDHMRDALKHVLYFNRYGREEHEQN